MQNPPCDITATIQLKTLELTIAVITGILVSYLVLNLENPTGWVTSLGVPRHVVVSLLFIIIGYLALGLFWPRLVLVSRYRHSFFVIAFLATFALILLYEMAIVAILVILMLSRAAKLYSMKVCLVLATIPTLSAGLVDHFVHELPYALASAVLFMLFNLAILVISLALASEQKEKERSEKLLRELQATQYLLSEAAKQGERLHISRELHDQVGHHLTALSLQLEVAINAKPDESRHHVQRARDISRMLLSDIRSTVSDIRSNSQIDLKNAIENLLQPHEGIPVVLKIDEHLTITSATIAETLFRCTQESLTNARKHSNATQVHIDIYQNAGQLHLEYRDNGRVVSGIECGNGLIGMRERINKVGGTMAINTSVNGFCLSVRIPQQEQ